MNKAIYIAIFILLPGVRAASAIPLPLTVEQIVDICESTTIAEATVKGDAQGWERANEKLIETWKTAFRNYNGGSVEVIGWRRGENEGDGLMSFWIATGPEAHKACAYSVSGQTGLPEALEKHFGPPDSKGTYDFGETAFWKKGRQEVTFSRTGSGALINIAYRN